MPTKILLVSSVCAIISLVFLEKLLRRSGTRQFFSRRIRPDMSSLKVVTFIHHNNPTQSVAHRRRNDLGGTQFSLLCSRRCSYLDPSFLYVPKPPARDTY